MAVRSWSEAGLRSSVHKWTLRTSRWQLVLVLAIAATVHLGVISLPGLAALLSITVPWYAVMTVRFPGFLTYHFFSEQAGHAFNTNAPRDCSPVPFGIFWVEHFFFLFPWILFLPAAIWAWRKRKPSAAKFELEPILWIWMLVTAVTISASADANRRLARKGIVVGVADGLLPRAIVSLGLR
jgi:hypothetical protein